MSISFYIGFKVSKKEKNTNHNQRVFVLEKDTYLPDRHKALGLDLQTLKYVSFHQKLYHVETQKIQNCTLNIYIIF